MGRYTTARSFDDRSTEVQAAPTEAEKEQASKKDVLEVQNTMGSTAGAGSGDFHQYRQSRRREMFRLERIETEAKKQEEIEAFEKRKRERADEVEAQRQKRADKRRKKKDKKKNKGGGGAAGPTAGKKPEGDDGSDSGEDEAEEKVAGPALGPDHDVFINGSIEAANAKVKEMNNVVIYDDD